MNIFWKHLKFILAPCILFIRCPCMKHCILYFLPSFYANRIIHNSDFIAILDVSSWAFCDIQLQFEITQSKPKKMTLKGYKHKPDDQKFSALTAFFNRAISSFNLEISSWREIGRKIKLAQLTNNKRYGYMKFYLFKDIWCLKQRTKAKIINLTMIHNTVSNSTMIRKTHISFKTRLIINEILIQSGFPSLLLLFFQLCCRIFTGVNSFQVYSVKYLQKRALGSAC